GGGGGRGRGGGGGGGRGGGGGGRNPPRPPAEGRRRGLPAAPGGVHLPPPAGLVGHRGRAELGPACRTGHLLRREHQHFGQGGADLGALVRVVVHERERVGADGQVRGDARQRVGLRAPAAFHGRELTAGHRGGVLGGLRRVLCGDRVEDAQTAEGGQGRRQRLFGGGGGGTHPRRTLRV